MKNTTHRVVILKNINSDKISQAILFLKDSAGENDTGLILEAEKIVEKYMNEKRLVSADTKTNKKFTAGFLSAGIMLLSLVLFIVLKLI